MILITGLKRWIKEMEERPLSDDYKKALDDFKKKLFEIEGALNQDSGTINIEITEIGTIGMSNFSGYALDGFQEIVDFIDRKVRKGNSKKFLVEVKERKPGGLARFFKEDK